VIEPPAGESWARRTFRSLHVRNFRLFFVGQLVSVVGLFMDYTARAWLVLELTGDGRAVGLTAGLGFAPLLVLGPWAGVLADRTDKRRMVLIAQAVLGVSALLLGVLVLTDAIQMWMVYTIVLVSGIATAFENPARRAFLSELVSRDDVANAVSLASSVAAAARAGGPAVAGLVIAAFGVAPAFIANGLSYVASMGSLLLMHTEALRPSDPVPRQRGQVREGLRYVATTPSVGIPLLLMALIGTSAFNYPVSIPIITTAIFEAGPEALGLALSLVAFGAFLGALYIAGRTTLSIRYLGGIAIVFGTATMVNALAPTLPSFTALLVATGFAGSALTVVCNGLLQRDAAPNMAGRVLALFSVAFIGSSAVGSPAVGLIAELVHARAGLGFGGAVAMAAGALTLVGSYRRRSSKADD
jgi:MFS family permease